MTVTATAVLRVVDRLGFACWRSGTGRHRRIVEVRSYPAASFTEDQPARIPVTLNHYGPELGHVVYLERGVDADDLVAVAVLDCDPEMVAGLRCSPDITATTKLGSTSALTSRLEELAIVGETAMTGTPAVRAHPGDFRSQYERERMPRTDRRLLDRAAVACPSPYEYRSSAKTPLPIHGPEHRGTTTRPLPFEMPAGPVEHSRHPGRIIAVY